LRQSEYRDKRSQYAARSESLLLDLYDDVLDDDDSTISRAVHDAAAAVQFSGRQDSDTGAETFLPNRADSSPSSVHRSRSYTDSLAEAAIMGPPPTARCQPQRA